MAVVASVLMSPEYSPYSIAPYLKLSLQLTDRPAFVMHCNQGLLKLTTITYEFHRVAFRVMTVSSAAPMARSIGS